MFWRVGPNPLVFGPVLPVGWRTLGCKVGRIGIIGIMTGTDNGDCCIAFATSMSTSVSLVVGNIVVLMVGSKPAAALALTPLVLLMASWVLLLQSVVDMAKSDKVFI